MASTPDTSFDSNEDCRIASTSKPISLPSPQLSEIASEEARGRDTAPAPKLVHDDDDDDGDEEEEGINSAYQTIWNIFCGQHIAEAYPTFHLRDQTSYERLLDKLDSHPGLLKHFEGLRKDWDASTGCLTLRLMASAIHDVTKRGIEAAIETALTGITTAHNLPYKILPGSHTNIQRRHSHSRVPYFDKSPDGQFYYDCAAAAKSTYRYPPFVLEIAYSQDGRDVQEVAKSFLRNMPGKICTVLALEIKYHGPTERKGDKGHHSASFTLRTTEREQEQQQQEEDEEEGGTLVVDCSTRRFRDDQGKALPGDLILPFKSFLPLEERDGCPDEEVRLSFAFLSELIDTAERRQRLNDATPTPEPEKFTKIRWRDEDGGVLEQRLQKPKRQRTEVPLAATRTRTRSGSQPRRSGRLRSSTRGGNNV